MRLVFLLLLTGIMELLAQAPVYLLPADNVVSGWLRSGAVGYCYTGSATTSQALYDIIDGGAEVYLERAYSGSAYDGYVNGPDTICVEIYNQGNTDSARSVYDYYRFGEYELLSGLGDRAKLDTSPAFGNKLELTSGPYFIRIYLQSKERTLVEEGRKLAQAIVTNSIRVERSAATITSNSTIRHYPDPLRNGCRFELALPGLGNRQCEITDSRGRLVSRITLSANNGAVYSGYWDGTNSKGIRMPAGNYFAAVRSGKKSVSARIVLSR